MKRRRFTPKLDKRFVETRDGYDVYSVNAFAVRNCAQPDEEFDCFATSGEFPDLIPKHEIWVSKKLLAAEGRYFIANALVCLKRIEQGSSEDAAEAWGAKLERELRKQTTGIRYRAGRPHKRVPSSVYVRRYLVLPDETGPIDVWLVDGSVVRSMYKTDYTQGGHGFVYPWCPKQEIWLERDLDLDEMPFALAHEYTELRLMRDEELEYDQAHAIASKVEFDLRKAKTRTKYPFFSSRKPSKAQSKCMTRSAFFDYVKRHELRGSVQRVGALLSDLAAR